MSYESAKYTHVVNKTETPPRAADVLTLARKLVRWTKEQKSEDAPERPVFALGPRSLEGLRGAARDTHLHGQCDMPMRRRERVSDFFCPVGHGVK